MNLKSFVKIWHNTSGRYRVYFKGEEVSFDTLKSFGIKVEDIQIRPNVKINYKKDEVSKKCIVCDIDIFSLEGQSKNSFSKIKYCDKCRCEKRYSEKTKSLI